MQVKTPEEALEDAYLQFRAALEAELLEAVTSASPAFFEELVVDLLVRMGYGGRRPDAAWAVGRTGDGGIDGVIDEDRLSLDVIYVQVTRWQGTVGRPEIQKFAGALQGQRAKKGICITTSKIAGLGGGRDILRRPVVRARGSEVGRRSAGRHRTENAMTVTAMEAPPRRARYTL